MLSQSSTSLLVSESSLATATGIAAPVEAATGTTEANADPSVKRARRHIGSSSPPNPPYRGVSSARASKVIRNARTRASPTRGADDGHPSRLISPEVPEPVG